MGNCFSDPSKAPKTGSGQKLGSGPPPKASSGAPAPAPAASTSRPAAPPQALGGVGGENGDARDRALAAAESRASSAKTKGVNASNPKAGQLSAKLAAERKAPTLAAQTDERLMDRGQWN